jgi:ribosomal protein S18 acetylase RimI-like enzyme
MSAANLVIRAATNADIPAMVDLLGILFAQEADFTPHPDRQRRALQLILDHPQSARLYCAVESDTVVGMVALHFVVSTAEGTWAAWLEDMVVRPDARGRGIGRRLLQHAIAEAKAAGCTRITLLTDLTNHSAARFYQREGFQPSAMRPFRLSLSRESLAPPSVQNPSSKNSTKY